MNSSVVVFFIHTALATLLLGIKFTSRKSPAFKNFGIGLLLNAAAFVVWTVGLIQPEIFLMSVTIGAIIFLASLVFFLRVSIQNTKPSTQLFLTGLGILGVLAIFWVGHIDPNYAYISPEGFFFFNLGPAVQTLYIFALALTAIPAIDTIASKFTSIYAALIRYGFIAEVVGAIILITNKNAQVLYIIGWIIGLAYLSLWITLFFSKKAWSRIN